MVRVTLSGTRQCLSVAVDASLVGQQAAIQDLTRSAFNDAMQRVGEVEAREQMGLVRDVVSDLPSRMKDMAGPFGAGGPFSGGGPFGGGSGGGQLR